MHCSLRVRLLISSCLSVYLLLCVTRTADAGLFQRLRRDPGVCYSYFYVEPKGVPKGAKVPVVLYLHGAGGVTLGPPDPKGKMFHRMAELGYLVLVPFYQGGTNAIRPYTWHPSAILGFKAALAEVRSRGNVVPDTERFALVGESLGGFFALRTAALAAQREDIPTPRAIIMQDGAGYTFAPYFTNRIRDVRRWCYTTAPFDEFSGVADDTLFVAMMAETTWKQDTVDEQGDGDTIDFGNAIAGGVVSRGYHTTGIPDGKRFVFLVRGDQARNPPLVSDHGVYWTPKDEVEQIYWDVTETALAAAFAEQSTDFSSQLSRTWSSGAPQLTVIPEIPKPKPFVWDCQSYLSYTPKSRWFMPRGVCNCW